MLVYWVLLAKGGSVMIISDIKTIAKVAFGLPFIVFGVVHFLNAAGMVGVVPAFLPVPLFFVYITGICLIAAGVGIIVDYHAVLACKLLALLLLIFILTIHLPGVMVSTTVSVAMPGLLKDLALMGGAFGFSILLDH
jgi:putative oxidoreductase